MENLPSTYEARHLLPRRIPSNQHQFSPIAAHTKEKG